jgi:hypothetical protein
MFVLEEPRSRKRQRSSQESEDLEQEPATKKTLLQGAVIYLAIGRPASGTGCDSVSRTVSEHVETLRVLGM